MMHFLGRNTPSDGRHPLEFSYVEKVNLFQDVTDRWYLEIADQVINGFEKDDPYRIIKDINADGTKINRFAHAGWAVLQISMSYFEVVGCFKEGMINRAKYDPKSNNNKGFNQARFDKGLADVSKKHLSTKGDVSEGLWKFRNGLYHAGDLPNIAISVMDYAVLHNETTGVTVVNPHRFVRELRKHLKAYVAELLAIEDETDTLRVKFEAAYKHRYTS